MAFEDLFAISYGKPLLDFLDTQSAGSLCVGTNGEICASIEEYQRRYPFATSPISIDFDGTITLQWKTMKRTIDKGNRIYWNRGKDLRTKKRIWILYKEDELYGGHPILEGEDLMDIKYIIQSYKLELKRLGRFEKLRDKQQKDAEEKRQWQKTHLFMVKGSTAPTNPWKVKLK
jgi:hypothetical protein